MNEMQKKGPEGAVNAPEDVVGLVTSLDLQSKRGRRIVFAALGTGAESLDTVMGKEIDVQDVVYHRVQVASQLDGTMQTVTRTVLITVDEKLYATVSPTLCQDVIYLGVLFGQPPWKPALRVKPETGKSTKGRKFFKLTLVDGEDSK